MTKEQLDMIERIAGLLGYIAGGTISIAKFFDYLKLKETQRTDREKEKSVGATKIIELMERDKKFERDIEALQKSDNSQDDKIDELKMEHKEIMSIVLNWFKPNK